MVILGGYVMELINGSGFPRSGAITRVTYQWCPRCFLHSCIQSRVLAYPRPRHFTGDEDDLPHVCRAHGSCLGITAGSRRHRAKEVHISESRPSTAATSMLQGQR